MMDEAREQQLTLMQITLRALALLLASPDVIDDDGSLVFGAADKTALGLQLLKGEVSAHLTAVISVSARPRFRFVLLRGKEIVCDLGISEI